MRLLHLSDLHLRSAQEGTADKPERLSRKATHLLEKLARRLPRLAPDVIVITGDILDVHKSLLTGQAMPVEERQRMVAAVLADYRLVRAWLSGTGLPYMILPGNHDLADSFAEVFGDQPAELEIAGVRLVAFHDWEQENKVPHRLGQQRRLFERVVADDHASAQIHLQHYLIRPDLVDADYPYNYADAADLADAIEKSNNVIAVLAGHYHTGALVHHHSGLHYSVVPAFCIEPHPYRVVDATPSGAAVFRDETLG